MLERYEQKVLLEYLLGLLKNAEIRTSKHKIEDFIENVIGEIDDAYRNGAISFKINIPEDKENDENVCKRLRLLIRELNKEHEKYKNTKLSIREKYFRAIKEIFTLSQEEINIFALISRCVVSDAFYNILVYTEHGYRRIDKLCKSVLKNSYTLSESIDNLECLGLLIDDNYRDLEKSIPDLLSNVLKENKKVEKNEIIENILGKRAKATLKKDDFAHLKKEFDMVQNILKNALKKNTKGINILLYGAPGTGKTEFSKTLARCLKVPLYETIYESYKREADRDDRLRDLCRKIATCKNINTKQLILFDEAEDVLRDTMYIRNTNSKAFVNKLLENNTSPIIWTTNDINYFDKAYLRRFTYSVKFEELDENLQLKFLKKEFNKNKFEIADYEIKTLSKKYELSSSAITNAIMLTTLTNSPKEKFEDFIKNQASLLNGGKEVTEKFNANKKTENYNFNLINTDIKMNELTKKIKQTGNLNFSLCLYGEAGTGKSEYAKQLASELGLEVIFKRASEIMSKWVGGTEENIANAFKEARDKKAVLIFDEADSFLQSRNNAQHSWEISQVNEMLTWMETHPYPFICTTNFMDCLDEASLRRFTFKIKFKYMTPKQIQLGFQHFFGKEVNKEITDIKGLTAGDFATVKKKIKFLGVDDIYEIKELLQKEVEVKKSKELCTNVGFM